MIHDSHKYGALTELRCAAELIKRDWHVAFPFVNQSAVDLIAFRESRFVTIQVKSGTMLINGHARIDKDFNKYKVLISSYAMMYTTEDGSSSRLKTCVIRSQ